MGRSELLECLFRARLGARLDCEDNTIHTGRGVPQSEDVPAQFVIRYLGCRAGKSFAFDAKLDGGSLEDIPAPVLSIDFARRSVKAFLIISETKLDRSPLTCLTPDSGQVRCDR